jgi:hypothetical protein
VIEKDGQKKIHRWTSPATESTTKVELMVPEGMTVEIFDCGERAACSMA